MLTPTGVVDRLQLLGWWTVSRAAPEETGSRSSSSFPAARQRPVLPGAGDPSVMQVSALMHVPSDRGTAKQHGYEGMGRGHRDPAWG